MKKEAVIFIGIREIFLTVIGFAFVLTAIVGLSTGIAMAQEEEKMKEEKSIPLEKIIVPGKPGEQMDLLETDLPRAELPRSVEGIDRDFMDIYGVDTVQDAVMRLSGVMPAIEGIYGRRNEDIMIRGQQYNPVMKNGFVMPARGYLVSDSANLKSFDIYKGPGSAAVAGMNDEGGYGGFLNLTTKKPFAQDFGATSLSVGAGSYDAWQTRFTGDFNQAIDDSAKWQFRLNTSLKVNRPVYMPSDSAYNPDQNYAITPVLKWQPTDHHSVIFELEYQHLDKLAQYGIPLEKQEPVLPYDTFIGNEYNNHKGDWLMSQVVGLWNLNSWHLRSGLSLMRLREEMRYWYIHGRVGEDVHNNRLDEAASDRIWETMGAYFDVTTKLDTGPIEHALLLRADFLRDGEGGWFDRSLRDEDETRPFVDLTALHIDGVPGGSAGDHAELETTRDCLGFALQDEMRIGPSWRVSLGVRLDRHAYIPYNEDEIDPRIMPSPRLGITWNVHQNLALYTAYSNTRSPNWGNHDKDGNEMKDSRYSNSYELGFKTQLTEWLLASGTVFRSVQKNLPVTIGDRRTGYQELQAELLAQGVEVSVNGAINENWSGTFSYTGQQFEDENGEDPITRNQPQHSFAFYPAYTHTNSDPLKGARIGLGIRYVGERYILGPGGMTEEDIMPDYMLFDVFAEYPLTKQSVLRLNLSNVLNEEYFTSARAAAQVERGEPFNVQITCMSRF